MLGLRGRRLRVVNDDFRGAEERIEFGCIISVLEYCQLLFERHSLQKGDTFYNRSIHQ